MIQYAYVLQQTEVHVKKGPKKLRPSLFVRLKLHLALRRSKRTPLEIGLDAMIPASLLAEIHAKADRQKI